MQYAFKQIMFKSSLVKNGFIYPVIVKSTFLINDFVKCFVFFQYLTKDINGCFPKSEMPVFYIYMCF